MIHALTLLTLLATQSAARDWPQFLGPDGDGRVALDGVDFNWSEEGPDVLWAFPTGVGYGGVAVRDGEVFLLDRQRGEGDILRVIDLDTGEEKWSVGYDAPGRLSFPGSRTVPTVTEKYVYSSGGMGQIACFDREQHEIKWIVNMQEDYEGIEPMFGWAAAPLVVGNIVIGTPLGDEVGLVGLDRFSGEEVWIAEGVGHSHSTPRLLNLLGREQVVFVSSLAVGRGLDTTGETLISSFDPQDGTLIWSTKTDGSRLPIPGISQVGDDRLFLTGGYHGGSSLLQIKKKGSKHEVEVLFHIERGSQIHPGLVYEDHIYVLVNGNGNNDRGHQKEGGLLCLNLQGEELWRTGNDPYFGRGNALLAGDHLLIQDGFNGTLRVAKATPAGYEQVAEANIFAITDRSDHQMWAPMALAGNLLLMRSQDELLCVEL